ncbi:MAG: hypothetical protein AB2L24_04380 [Mangrovibacterium sp.]
MANRRKFIKQLTTAGVASTIPSILYSKPNRLFVKAEIMSKAIQNQLYIGWGEVNITPEKTVALTGQLYKRMSRSVQDPLTATVLAIETLDDSGVREQTIMISCDLLFIRAQTQSLLHVWEAE